MSFLAALFVIAAAWALVSGSARWVSGAVTRANEPISFWASIATCLLIAWLLFALGPVR